MSMNAALEMLRAEIKREYELLAHSDFDLAEDEWDRGWNSAIRWIENEVIPKIERKMYE
jgi:hypothetical protein